MRAAVTTARRGRIVQGIRVVLLLLLLVRLHVVVVVVMVWAVRASTGMLRMRGVVSTRCGGQWRLL